MGNACASHQQLRVCRTDPPQANRHSRTVAVARLLQADTVLRAQATAREANGDEVHEVQGDMLVLLVAAAGALQALAGGASCGGCCVIL